MFDQDPDSAVQRAGTRAEVDAGLRAHMQNVYNAMAAGLVVSGLVAYIVASTPALLNVIFANQITYLVVAFSPLALLLFAFRPAQIARMSVTAVSALYFGFVGLMGLSLSAVFVLYTTESIAQVFFITAGTFAAMSIYGYTTKRDLSAMGDFLFMGLIGILIAGVVNIFMQSSMMAFVISIIGVGVFVGLTAWDTQRIKETYHASIGRETMAKMAIMGALSLYLDFINLFQFLLYLLGRGPRARRPGRAGPQDCRRPGRAPARAQRRHRKPAPGAPSWCGACGRHPGRRAPGLRPGRLAGHHTRLPSAPPWGAGCRPPKNPL